MTNQALTLEFGEYRQRLFDGSFRWPHQPSNPKIDDVELVEPEIAKIVMNGIDQFLRERAAARICLRPGARPPW